MRIGVLRTQVPFVSGGAERHAANLVQALQRHGHSAAEITVPFKWYPGEVLADHILAAKLLDVSEVEGVPVDRMIGLKFPAYLARHPDMQFWIIHQHRQAYDQWALGNSDLLDDPDGAALRDLIRAEDRAAFEASAHPIYANSQNVATRLQDHLDLASTALYHPPPQASLMTQGGYGDYLFAPGRINPSKRLDLILQALAKARSKIRLVIAGRAENPAYEAELHRLAAELGLSAQVDWLGGVDDDTLRRTYAEARAVVFVPQDEDYGYITLEAMLSAKPVITVTDAGGPLEFIRHGVEGLITAPARRDLAGAFERIMQDATGAEKMGQAGLARYLSMNISWDHVVESLTGASTPQPLPMDAAAPGQGELPEDSPAPEDPQAHAVALLKAAIAPPPPPADFPFASITEVLESFAFEELPAELGQPDPPVDAGLAGYLGTHWTRYLTTLEALKDLTPKDVLDVGVFPPLVFQAMLFEVYPGINMSGLWEGPQPYAQEVRRRADNSPAFSIRLEPANSERDPWPYPDNSFDLVTGMEILEHLALDPSFFFAEANRVLRPGGHILLTTPNVTSHRGVWKMMNGIAPYSFGIFVPSGGVYGRHNREYAPPELAEIGQAAGFETVSLRTVDVYDRDMDPGTAELLVGRDDNLALRGETIFYLAQKTADPAGTALRFYHGDPSLMSAAFHPGPREVATGLISLGLENRSGQWWPVTGARATCLLAEWIDPDGVLIHQILIQPLSAPVAPGETRAIPLLLDAGEAASDQGQLRLHCYQSGVGVFSGSGRAAPVILPCSRAAFQHLARTAPKPGDAG
jgi:glycosyltransferase involved in cell wall biosynthesis/SAM-dependent methyltransferase